MEEYSEILTTYVSRSAEIVTSESGVLPEKTLSHLSLSDRWQKFIRVASQYYMHLDSKTRVERTNRP